MSARSIINLFNTFRMKLVGGVALFYLLRWIVAEWRVPDWYITLCVRITLYVFS